MEGQKRCFHKMKSESDKIIEFFMDLGQKVENWKPDMYADDQLTFDPENVTISLPNLIEGEGQFRYSSYKEAEAAALTAIDMAMYSRRQEIIRELIEDYRNEKLSSYLFYEELDQNFYYKANKKAEIMLSGFALEYKEFFPDKPIPKEFYDFSPPQTVLGGWHVKVLSEKILDMAEVIFHESDLEEDTLTYYANSYYCTIHEKLELGVKKYCFMINRLAFEEIAMDIKDACESCFNDCIVESIVRGCVRVIMKKYIHILQDELYYKIYQLMENVYIPVDLE